MPSPYYSQRRGGIVVRDRERLSEDFWTGYRALIREMLDKNYFCEYFHADCPDGHPLLWDDEKIRGRLLQEVGRAGWPLSESLPEEEVAFDYMEFLGDYVSMPTNLWFHPHCQNYHPRGYDAQKGRIEYRERVNKLFRNLRHPYYLDENCRIRKESSPILDLPIRDADFVISDAHLRTLLDQALADFYDRTGKKKVQAVRSLVDAYERLKTIENQDKKQSVEQVIKKISPFEEARSILGNDMKDLTDIANQFTIRHHEVSKKVITDEGFLDYLFYQYYNMIRLVLKKYGMARSKP